MDIGTCKSVDAEILFGDRFRDDRKTMRQYLKV